MAPLSGSLLEDVYGDLQKEKSKEKSPESFQQTDTSVNNNTDSQNNLKHEITNKRDDQENTNSIKKYLVDLVQDNSEKFLGKMEKFTSNEIDINLIREIILLLKFIVMLLLLLLINQISKK